MTSPPQPVPGEDKSAGQYLRPLRDLAAYALIGAPAVFLVVAVIHLIPDGSLQFGYLAANSFFGFINLPTIFFPLAAVLLALLIRPRHPRAQLIVQAAVVEYAVMAFFSVLFGVLIGLIKLAADTSVRAAFEGLLERVAWLAVFAVAAYAMYQIWRNMFYTPKPQVPSNVYGQFAGPGAPASQPGFGPQPGQPYPGPSQPGQPYPGQPGQPGQPDFGGQPDVPPSVAGYPPVPGQYGQPQSDPYGQPQSDPYGQPTPNTYGQSRPDPYGQPPVQGFTSASQPGFGQPTPPWSQPVTPPSSAPPPAPSGSYGSDSAFVPGLGPYPGFAEPNQDENRTHQIGNVFPPADPDHPRR